jgi:arylsulfatase A-like enzyme
MLKDRKMTAGICNLPPKKLEALSKLIFPLLFLLSITAAAQPDKPRPNLIFIMVDDLGYGDLGSYGQDVIPTPFLDQMAREGMRFTQAYAGAPVCAPSRSVLMTGQHSGHTLIRGNFSAVEVPELPNPRRIPLRPEDTTVAEVLQQAGYVTGMFGKWGLGEAATTGEPNRQGFDEWVGFLNQRRAHSHYPEFLWENQDTLKLSGNADKQRQQHTHPLFTEYALDFINRHHDTTFFLYLPYCLPHSEIAATPPYADLYKDKDWTDKQKHFAGMISMIDSDVGRLLNLLKAHGIAENTLVFFCSDNGAANRYDGLFDSSGPLRGRKRDMYEGGIRTPMIAWMPGSVPAGAVSDYPWYFPDVLPTLAAVAGTEAPKNIDGMNIAPALFGEDLPLTDRFMYWEFHEKGFDQAVRWKNWKAVRQGLNDQLELYNLAEDPAETNDVSRKNKKVVKTIESYLAEARSPSIYWPAGQGAPRD